MDMFNLQLQQMALTMEIQEVRALIQEVTHRQQLKQVKVKIAKQLQLTKPKHKYVQRARWSYQEDLDLLQLVKHFGLCNYAALYENMPHKYKDQIYFRIRYLRNQFRLF
ncbi:Homeobox-like_domain superfamily [Hexamita inflata]|uniref:Homeobox-like domain superfamily n=1 Tax=Hexamita inflata TaxID=28002 RepID=A0AA86RCQ8_9EUKA|nr:Homeobox-like domain superfamily [Hexamita inflata]